MEYFEGAPTKYSSSNNKANRNKQSDKLQENKFQNLPERRPNVKYTENMFAAREVVTRPIPARAPPSMQIGLAPYLCIRIPNGIPGV